MSLDSSSAIPDNRTMLGMSPCSGAVFAAGSAWVVNTHIGGKMSVWTYVRPDRAAIMVSGGFSLAAHSETDTGNSDHVLVSEASLDRSTVTAP